jgi:hypothetical protein
VLGVQALGQGMETPEPAPPLQLTDPLSKRIRHLLSEETLRDDRELPDDVRLLLEESAPRLARASETLEIALAACPSAGSLS